MQVKSLRHRRPTPELDNLEHCARNVFTARRVMVSTMLCMGGGSGRVGESRVARRRRRIAAKLWKIRQKAPESGVCGQSENHSGRRVRRQYIAATVAKSAAATAAIAKLIGSKKAMTLAKKKKSDKCRRKGMMSTTLIVQVREDACADDGRRTHVGLVQEITRPLLEESCDKRTAQAEAQADKPEALQTRDGAGGVK
ncbi:hypothetical protein B0H13DRAFT_1853075 [Mycena leptocephala]|nr:hypothetical protein B0H13DRAFT_1853075 [Mycena leptocephala]